MRILVLIVVLLAVIGCSSSRKRSTMSAVGVTLCIQNEAAGYGDLVVQAAGARIRVPGGGEVCRDLGRLGAVSIRATSTGGGMAGPLRYSFQLPPGGDCWHWRVSGPGGALDVVPCEGY